MNQRQTQDKLFIFNEQVHQAILNVMQENLPLEISARDLDDRKLWEILCHASVEAEPIEQQQHADRGREQNVGGPFAGVGLLQVFRRDVLEDDHRNSTPLLNRPGLLQSR